MFCLRSELNFVENLTAYHSIMINFSQKAQCTVMDLPIFTAMSSNIISLSSVAFKNKPLYPIKFTVVQRLHTARPSETVRPWPDQNFPHSIQINHVLFRKQ